MGFDLVRFQGDVDEELVCPICSGVLEDPVQVSLDASSLYTCPLTNIFFPSLPLSLASLLGLSSFTCCLHKTPNTTTTTGRCLRARLLSQLHNRVADPAAHLSSGSQLNHCGKFTTSSSHLAKSPRSSLHQLRQCSVRVHKCPETRLSACASGPVRAQSEASAAV